jgi:hypothetical protein
MRRTYVWLAALAVLTVFTSGCGTTNGDATFVARVNELCRRWVADHEEYRGPPPELKELRDFVGKHETLSVARKWRAYAARRRLVATLMVRARDLANTRPSDEHAMTEYHALYAQDYRLYEEERALGLRNCPGLLPPQQLRPAGT